MKFVSFSQSFENRSIVNVIKVLLDNKYIMTFLFDNKN